MRFISGLKRSTASTVRIPALASAVLAIVLIALSSSTTVAGAKPASAIEIVEGDVSLLPVATIERDSGMLVEFVIRNCSANALAYFPGSLRRGLESLDTMLICEDGTSIPYSRDYSDWLLNEKYIRTLAPGDMIEVKVVLHQQFGFDGEGGNFPNGRYELRAVRRPSGRGGSTPIKIDSPVMLIDVVDELPPQNTEAMGLLLIAVTTFAIAEGMALVYGFRCLRARRLRKRARQE